MKVWLPYTEGGSGSDVSTRFLAQGIEAEGHQAIAQVFHHNYQYSPWFLKAAKPPRDTDVIITNTWNGFAFHRPDKVNITVERLFVLDPAYRPYRSVAQAIFHETLIRHFVRRSVVTADACVAVSHYSARALAAELRLPVPKTILNAVDTDIFKPLSQDQRLTERIQRPFRLLFVGNFTRRKGADLIVEVMRQLGSEYELHFTSGIRVKEQKDYPENMHCLGRLSLEQVREAYRQADALLFPSRLEGLPRTVMEAMACATPVIAANASSIPEAVDDGVSGRICAPDDPSAFVQAIREVAADAGAWEDMTVAARNTAEKRFSLKRMVGEYISLATALKSEKQSIGGV